MERSNNNSAHRLINGFQNAASTANTFQSAFQGMQQTNANNFGLLQAQLQSLSNPILPSADIAQWAAATAQQPHNQQWIGGVDPAKVVQMLPMYQMFTNVKSMDFPQTDLVSHGLQQQQNIQSGSSQFSGTPSSTLTSTPSMVQSPRLSHLQDVRNNSHGSPQCPLSNGPPSSHHSHHSTSTPNDIDVGMSLSQPASQQNQAFDLSMRPHSKESESTQSPLVVDQLPPHQQHINVNNLGQAYLNEPSTSSSNQNQQQNQSQALDEDQWIDNIDISRFDIPANLDLNAVFQPEPRRASGGGSSSNFFSQQNDLEDGCEFDKVFKMVTDKNDGTGADSIFGLGTTQEDTNRLSPIQFTPPDSPEPAPSGKISSLFGSPKSISSFDAPSTSSGLSSSAASLFPSTSRTPASLLPTGLGSLLGPSTSTSASSFLPFNSAKTFAPSSTNSSILGSAANLVVPSQTTASSQVFPSTSNATSLQLQQQKIPSLSSTLAQVQKQLSKTQSKEKQDSFKPPPTSANKVPVWKKAALEAKEPPKLAKPVQKSTKIPVYKQKLTSIGSMKEEDGDKKGGKDDAFDFDEDDEPVSLVQQTPREKLDADLKERISKLSAQSDGRARNVYVPGVGFAVPPEHSTSQDLWRHVVPKKRLIGENRPIIPSTNLLPASVHAEANQAAARLADPEIVDLAESIRRRKKERLSCSFIKTEATTSQDCAKEEGADQKAEILRSEDNRPRLPKLIIKLPRRPTVEETKPSKRSRKRKDSSDDDTDWEGSDAARKKRGRKSGKRGRRSYSGYEVRLVERDDEPPEDYLLPNRGESEDKSDVMMLSKKRRFMKQWEEGQENGEENGKIVDGVMIKQEVPDYSAQMNGQPTGRANGHTLEEQRRLGRRMTDFNTEAVKTRLSKFSSAEGKLAKGTFVVNKQDLFRDDCALWKVDNQNLLQKFPPRTDPITKVITYRNSSTYSGWCDQIASSYYTVKVKMLKQSRSESIVEPEVPLNDLFVAVSADTSSPNGFVKGEDGSNEDVNEVSSITRDSLKSALLTFVQVMVNHAFSLDYIQTLKEKNDWNFLNAETEINRANLECEQKLKSLLRGAIPKYEEWINMYTCLSVCDIEQRDIQCQACGIAAVDKIVQLFSKDSYDSETLHTIFKEEDDDAEDGPLPAMEFYVCTVCSVVVQYHHKCHHLKYHLLKRCEDRLECFGTQFPDYAPEKIVELAKKSRGWIEKFIDECIDMWKKIEDSKF